MKMMIENCVWPRDNQSIAAKASSLFTFYSVANFDTVMPANYSSVGLNDNSMKMDRAIDSSSFDVNFSWIYILTVMLTYEAMQVAFSSVLKWDKHVTGLNYINTGTGSKFAASLRNPQSKWSYYFCVFSVRICTVICIEICLEYNFESAVHFVQLFNSKQAIQPSSRLSQRKSIFLIFSKYFALRMDLLAPECAATSVGTANQLFQMLIQTIIAAQCGISPKEMWPKDYGPTAIEQGRLRWNKCSCVSRLVPLLFR